MAAAAASRRHPAELAGSWELGLIGFMVALYLVGIAINPVFFGSADALGAVLRDTARYGVMAVGMTIVIVNRELDLSVGSTLGLVATVFSVAYAPSHLDLGAGAAVAMALAAGILVGLVNGYVVTTLRVPAFIATLTMLFIGRGLVLGLTGGKTIAYQQKSAADPWFFAIGGANPLGFDNQILIFALVAALGMVLLAKTRIGYETYAVGGNEQAARYAGIASPAVRRRAYLLSSLCATLAGLMNVAQDKGITSQYGQGAELIVIAAVIVGGAAIAGGRGRVLGACLGAATVVLIDKVLREGVPVTRIVEVAGIKMEIQAYAQLPPGAVPAFLGLLLLVAVLIEPWLMRDRGPQRLWARLTGASLPPRPPRGDVAIAAVQTRGATIDQRATQTTGLRAFLARRDAAALLLCAALWLAGLALRPDFWGGLDNSFAIALAFSEIALLAIGLAFVIGNGDIDLSVGAVLALAAAVAAFAMKELGLGPGAAAALAMAAGLACGAINGWLTIRCGLPSFVATLGMFYMARGIAVWLVAGRQLSGFPEGFVLLGRPLIDVLAAWGIAPVPGSLVADVARAVSVQTIFIAVVAVVAAVVLGRTRWGQMIYAVGGNERAARYAGIDTNAVRFWSLVFCAGCAAAAGIIYAAYLRSFNPAAGLLRELDAIAAVVIGGGSIFGGYGTILGALAGAGAITLIRSILSLQIILPDGRSFVMPQHWMNVFIGLILLGAVVADIWLRQEGLLRRALRRARDAARMPT
jgi:ribose transport system permease protein